MRKAFIVSLILVLVFSFEEDYDTAFLSSYNEAICFIKTNEYKFKEILGDDAALKEKVAIVFPEILKYSTYKDIIETRALELLYVNYGKEQMDFSIGYFQMKPSFVEKLEGIVLFDTCLQKKYLNIINFKDSTIKQIRKQRIKRLKSLEWQLKYLNCFYDINLKIHPEVSGFNKELQVRFLASAYNYDFTDNKENIEKWIYKRIFPFGVRKSRMQYAYSDIAFYYYKNY